MELKSANLLITLVILLTACSPGAATKSTPVPTQPGTAEPAQPENMTATPQGFSIGDTQVSEKDGMTMVFVPAGEFRMGTTAEEALSACKKTRDDCLLDWFTRDEPPHIVYLDSYWLDQTEVTNAMFAAFLNEAATETSLAEKWMDINSLDLKKVMRIHRVENAWQVDPGFEDFPAIEIFWEGAQAYCDWAGRRLPTEAEWEKAASWDDRNKRKRIYPWGDTLDCQFANYSSCVKNPTAVGSYESGKSPYGAYDMAGNVWEWVEDWYDVYPGGDKSADERFGQTHRVVRGGSTYTIESIFGSSHRYRRLPTDSNDGTGFRCAMDAE